MADRTNLDANFISLVLSVNGRVRPLDLHSIPEAERANALQTFFQSHAASMPLHFDGDVLVAGPGSGAPAPAPAPAPAATPGTPAPVPADAGAPGIPDIAEPAPAAAAPFDDLPAEPSFSDYAPVGSAPAEPAITENDFFAIQTGPADVPMAAPDSDAGAGDAPAREMEFPAERVSWVLWLLPILLTWAGGIVAYFLVRKRNAKTAKAMLVTGLVLTLVFALAGVAAVVGLGLLAVPGLS